MRKRKILITLLSTLFQIENVQELGDGEIHNAASHVEVLRDVSLNVNGGNEANDETEGNDDYEATARKMWTLQSPYPLSPCTLLPLDFENPDVGHLSSCSLSPVDNEDDDPTWQ